MSQKSGGGGRADALEGLKALSFVSELRGRGNEFVQMKFDLLQLALEMGDGSFELLADVFWQARDEACLLTLQDHLELVAACDPSGELLLDGAGKGCGGGLEVEAEEGKDMGVDAIGLGQAAGGLGKVAPQARVDEREVDASRGEGEKHRAFPAAGGFADDLHGFIEGVQGFNQRGAAWRIVGELERLAPEGKFREAFEMSIPA